MSFRETSKLEDRVEAPARHGMLCCDAAHARLLSSSLGWSKPGRCFWRAHKDTIIRHQDVRGWRQKTRHGHAVFAKPISAHRRDGIRSILSVLLVPVPRRGCLPGFRLSHRRKSSVNFRGGHDIFARKICFPNFWGARAPCPRLLRLWPFGTVLIWSPASIVARVWG